MTRINLIHPSKLADQHLLAEWREIVRIPAYLQKRLNSYSIRDTLRAIPVDFTLGTGHVTFFYDKLLFVAERYIALTEELKQRAFNVNTADYSLLQSRIDSLPQEFKKTSYKPSMQALEASNARLLEKIHAKPNWYRYNGVQMDVKFFENLYGNPV